MTMTLLEAILSIGINPDPNQWIWVLPTDDGKITPECPAKIDYSKFGPAKQIDWGPRPGPDGYSRFGNAKQIDWDLTDYPLGFAHQTRESIKQYIWDVDNRQRTMPISKLLDSIHDHSVSEFIHLQLCLSSRTDIQVSHTQPGPDYVSLGDVPGMSIVEGQTPFKMWVCSSTEVFLCREPSDGLNSWGWLRDYEYRIDPGSGIQELLIHGKQND